MLWIFHALTDRLKALFVADVAADFEAQLFSRQAERQADLLRQAGKYEEEGLPAVARQLRQRADQLTLERPLATILPAIGHLQSDPSQTPALAAAANGRPAALPISQPKKKGRGS